jgi:uncharacterized membrane protein YphA (DoxX/SURF4 family)
MKKAITIEIITTLLVALFFYASFSKIADIAGFQRDMRMQPFPTWAKAILLWAVPAVEIVISILLIPERTRLAGLYAYLLVMSLFTIYTALVLFHFFSRVPCPCGGVIRRLKWWQHMILNLVFIGFTIVVLILKKGKKGETRTEKQEVTHSKQQDQQVILAIK